VRVIGCDIKHDVRIVARKLRQLRPEQLRARKPGQQQPQPARRFVAQARELVQSFLHLGDRGAQARKELLSRFGGRDAARGA